MGEFVFNISSLPTIELIIIINWIGLWHIQVINKAPSVGSVCDKLKN